MKKISKLLLATFVVLLTLHSCENDSSINKTQKYGPITTTKVTDPKYKIKLQNYITKNKIHLKNSSLMKDGSNIEFNLDDLYLVTNSDSDKTALVANEVDFDPNKTINYGLTFYQDSEHAEIFKTLIVKTEKVESDINRIYYYDSDGTPLLTLKINYATQTVDVVYIISTDSTTGRGKLCSGQVTADCLGDVYAHHGWVSVWASIQTAFIPATIGALAIACAYSC